MSKCPSLYKCQKEASEEPHTCPYSEEINEDFETLCTCCEECVQECIYEI